MMEGLKYKCELCDIELNSRSNMYNHTKLVHKKIRPHGCDQCDPKKYFHSRSALRIHIEGTHEDINYFCNLCEKSYNFKGNLLAHIKRVHKPL